MRTDTMILNFWIYKKLLWSRNENGFFLRFWLSIGYISDILFVYVRFFCDGVEEISIEDNDENERIERSEL